MLTRAELKEKAKESLKGKYGDAIVITILFTLITGIAGGVSNVKLEDSSITTTISLVAGITELIVAGLLTFGYINYFLKLSRGEEAKIDELWSKANMFGIFIVASILIGLFVSLWTLLLIIPGIIAAYSYQMTYYILLDNPGMDVMDAIKKGVDPKEAYEKNIGTYGRFADAVKYIDPREE